MLPIITGKNKPDIAACVVILQMVGWTLRIVSYKIIAKDGQDQSSTKFIIAVVKILFQRLKPIENIPNCFNFECQISIIIANTKNVFAFVQK
jgi:hypothetical protein